MKFPRLLIAALLMLSLSAFCGLTEAVQAYAGDTIELSQNASAPIAAEVEPFDHEPDLMALVVSTLKPTFHPPLCMRSLALITLRPARPTPPPDLA